eukprot:259087-Pleurochrysis_carterae.AAC.1
MAATCQSSARLFHVDRASPLAPCTLAGRPTARSAPSDTALPCALAGAAGSAVHASSVSGAPARQCRRSADPPIACSSQRPWS